MHILHIISSLQIGGAQKLLSELLPELAKNDDLQISILVLCDSPGAFEDILKNNEKISFHSLHLPNVRSVKAISGIRRHISNADIVHVHLFPTLYFVALANIGINKPLIYTEHSTHNRRREKPIFRPIEKLIYNRYSKLIAISQPTADNLHNWIQPSKTDLIETVYNGVNLSKFHINKTDPENVFGRSGWPVIMVSRFTTSKDHATLLRAMSLIDKPDIFLVLAGEGETLEQNKQLAKELNINNKVIFLGNQTDIPRLLNASKLGVQASNWEGFGLSAVEMMAAGLPVIASDIPGLNEVVEGFGVLFKKNDAHELAHKILEIHNNPDLYKSLTNKSGQRASNFSISATASSLIQIYRVIY